MNSILIRLKLFVAGFVFALLATPVLAEEAHGGGHAKSKGLLDIATDLGIWTLVVFVLLLLILRKLAWKPMLEGLQKREENIRSAVEEAQRARDEAKASQAQIQARLDRASEEVRGILDEARRDAQYTKDQMVAAARAEIQTERERLRREIDTARDQALKELSDHAAQLATLVSAKVIRRQLSQDDHRRLVSEALTDLQKAASDRRN